MAKTVIGERGFYKLDHPCFREVYETTYIEDVITDIHLGEGCDNSLLNLPNTCEVEDSGVLPVFYNCKKGCYADQTGLPIGDALVDGVKAFEVGESVKVLCEQEEPKYIIGHARHEPRMCADIFKMKTVGWNGKTYYTYYIGSTAQEYCVMSESDSCVDLYGTQLSEVCTEKGYVLFGQREFQSGTIMNYWGDFFIKVGPIMYIFRLTSIGLPGIFTGQMFLYGAIWTEELEAECKRLGAIAEESIGGAFDPMPTFPVYPDSVKLQRTFTKTFVDRFYGVLKDYAPRWVYTEFWGQR